MNKIIIIVILNVLMLLSCINERNTSNDYECPTIQYLSDFKINYFSKISTNNLYFLSGFTFNKNDTIYMSIKGLIYCDAIEIYPIGFSNPNYSDYCKVSGKRIITKYSNKSMKIPFDYYIKYEGVKSVNNLRCDVFKVYINICEYACCTEDTRKNTNIYDMKIFYIHDNEIIAYDYFPSDYWIVQLPF
ncbi:MAG: hypothetical protein MH137_03960 [Flavobacteriales bacterium]|nr:hypothetical protein [Flavobacteriales bacterium]